MGEDAANERLSSSDVARIVTKLRALDVLAFGDAVVCGADGRSYVTRERLREEVAAEVRARGGRATITALGAALGVDVAHCEREAKALARDDAFGAKFLEGEIMTAEYFDGIAREIAETLRDVGSITISECARRFLLSADLVSRVMRERVTSIVEAKMEGPSFVYTVNFADRLGMKIRNALCECSVPTAKEALIRAATGEEAADSSLPLASKLLNDLIKAKTVQGIMTGGFWYPEVHLMAQRKKLCDLYERRGIVTVDAASQLGIDAKETKSIIASLDQGHVDFGTHFVAKRVVDEYETSVAETIEEQGYCCSTDALPDGLGVEVIDSTSLLETNASVGEYLVSHALFKKCMDAARRVGATTAENVLQENEADIEVLRSMLFVGRGEPHAPIASSDGKGVKKIKKNKNSNRAEESVAAVSSATEERKTPLLPSNILKDADITSSLRRILPDADQDFLHDLTRVCKSAAVVEFNERVSFCIANFGDKLKMSRELAAKQFLDLYPTAVLVSKGTEEILADDVYAMKYACRQYAVPCVDAFLRSQMEKSLANGDDSAPLTEKHRVSIVENFPNYPAEAKPMGRVLLDAVRAGKSPVVVMESVATLAEAFGLRLPALNRSTVRTMLHAHKKGLEEQLRGERDVAKALLIAVPYLVAVTRGKVVAITGRSLVKALDMCGEGLDAARREVIGTAIARVVDELAGSTPTAPTVDIEVLKEVVLGVDAKSSQHDVT